MGGGGGGKGIEDCGSVFRVLLQGVISQFKKRWGGGGKVIEDCGSVFSVLLQDVISHFKKRLEGVGWCDDMRVGGVTYRRVVLQLKNVGEGGYEGQY